MPMQKPLSRCTLYVRESSLSTLMASEKETVAPSGLCEAMALTCLSVRIGWR